MILNISISYSKYASFIVNDNNLFSGIRYIRDKIFGMKSPLDASICRCLYSNREKMKKVIMEKPDRVSKIIKLQGSIYRLKLESNSKVNSFNYS